MWSGTHRRLLVVSLAFLAAPARLLAQTFGPDVPLNTNAAVDVAYDSHARVATDGRGNWVAVWDANAFGYDRDILVARSTDAGLTWTAPVALNADASTDGEYAHDQFPEIVTDGETWLVVWSASFLGIRCARSNDAGVTWSAPFTIYHPSSFAFVHVATNRRGTWIVAWDANGFGNINGARSTDGGVTWTAPFPLSPSLANTFDYRPRIATDGSGAWVAAWSSYTYLGGGLFTDYDLFMARSTDDGVTWTAPVPLNVNAAVDSGLDTSAHLIANANGTWLATWLSTESFGAPPTGWRAFVARSTDGGLTWSFPEAIVDSDTPGGSSYENEPKVACDGRGTCLVAMQDANIAVRVSASHDDGVTWTPAVRVSSWSGWNPFAATDGLGTWLVTWNAPRDARDDEILMVRGAICGDGALGPGEDCERGVTLENECCSTTSCRFEAVGTGCRSDEDPCTDDVCDGAGTCMHPANTAPCDDGDPCTVMDHCVDDVCAAGTPVVCASPCETCNVNGECTFPRDAGCDVDTAAGSTVALRRGATPSRDKLAWRWRSVLPLAPSDFGDASATDPFILCIADEGSSGPVLRLDSAVPTAGTCGRRDCWRARGTGERHYWNPTATPDGITSLRIRPGKPGSGRIDVRGKGLHLGVPTLPLAPSVTVRLQHAGRCWDTQFDAPARNDEAEFRGRSD